MLKSSLFQQDGIKLFASAETRVLFKTAAEMKRSIKCPEIYTYSHEIGQRAVNIGWMIELGICSWGADISRVLFITVFIGPKQG